MANFLPVVIAVSLDEPWFRRDFADVLGKARRQNLWTIKNATSVD
jgi:hypothetical protein